MEKEQETAPKIKVSRKALSVIIVVAVVIVVAFIIIAITRQTAQAPTTNQNDNTNSITTNSNDNNGALQNDNSTVVQNQNTNTKEDSAKAITENIVSTDSGEVVVVLNPENNSGQSGTVVLTPDGNKTRVAIRLLNYIPSAVQPAYIYEGRCASLGKARHVLNNVAFGGSYTIISISLDQLKAEPELAVAISSPQPVNQISSCGNIGF